MADSRSAPWGADAMIQRPHEVPTLVATQRLCMVVLAALALLSAGRSQPWVWLLVLGFGMAASANLWRVVTGRASSTSDISYYWAATLFPVLVARGTEGGALLLVLLLYPLTMSTLLHGLRHGLLLGLGSAAVWLLDVNGAGLELQRTPVALAFVLLPLITSLISAAIAAQRQRLQLVAELEQSLDPRRGLAAVGVALAERLRTACAARRVLVCHCDAEVPTVLVSDADDGNFAASAGLGGRVLALLNGLPKEPLAIQASSGFISNGLERRHQAAEQQAAAAPLMELAQLLEAELLQLVPDAPGSQSTGWTLVAYGADQDARPSLWPLPTLAGFAGDMRRLLQQASYVDRLQEEITAHERSRIGRDLHDSAIQPYMGLKFAIEALALRCDGGNPLHAHVQELRNVCEAELVELRKTVSALRAGGGGGENSLAMALQRQCARFARLFGIQVELQVPADLAMGRTLMSALLHMVNEALNNVRRHTEARKVWVSLATVPGALHLVIRDDAGQRQGKPMPPFEPRSLTERALELGGSLELRRHHGLDTELHITLPT